MAKLSTSQRATIVWLIDYLNGAVDRPVDPLIPERLAPIFGGTTDFPCPCGSRGISLQDSFRDEPVRTFLRILIGVGGETLTVTSFAQLQALVDYLQGSPAWPVDPRVVEILADLFGCSTEFPGACGSRGGNIQDAMRDEPVRTFLRLILILSDAQ